MGDIDQIPKAAIQRKSDMASQRVQYDRTYQEIRELMWPNAEDFTKYLSPGQIRNNRIFDDTAQNGIRSFASGFHSFMTNPASRWFELTTRNAVMDRQSDSLLWMEGTSDQVYDVLQDPRVSSTMRLHQVFEQLGAFGTGIMQCWWDCMGQMVRLRTYPLAKCWIAEDENEMVDTMVREVELTRHQALALWGNRCPKEIIEHEDKGNTLRRFKFIHEVIPMENTKVKVWDSHYVCEDFPCLMEKGYFRIFPYLVPRWTKVPGEVYGRSPAMECFFTVRMLNECQKLMLRSSQLASAPPLILDDDSVMAKIHMEPFEMIYKMPGSAPIVPLELKSNFQVTERMIESMQASVRKAFYNDLFKMPDFGNRERVTAQEVVSSQNENLRMLSPMLGNIELELLNPMIQTIYEILLQRGRLQPAPRSLKGAGIMVSYLGQAARAQKAQKAQNTLQFVQQIVPYTQQQPEIMDAIDMDKVIQDAATAMDVSRLALRTSSEIATLRANRAKAQQQSQIAGQAQQAAAALKDVATARQTAPDLLGAQT